MRFIAMLAAFALPLHPLDLAWARLAHDLTTGDARAFATDRAEIVRLDQEELSRWGAKPKEVYQASGYTVATYTGPTKARGERWHSAYFAIVTPDGDLQAPTFWELTPGYSPARETLWFLSVSGCDLASGDSLVGHIRFWRTSGLDQLPKYEDFKANLAPLAATKRAFPTDTTVGGSPGATCLYVGDIDTQPVFPNP